MQVAVVQEFHLLVHLLQAQLAVTAETAVVVAARRQMAQLLVQVVAAKFDFTTKKRK
jgi:hypothetical protein